MRFDLVEHERQAKTWLPWELIRGNERDIRYARRDLAGLAEAIKRCRRLRVAVQAGGNVGVFPIFLARFFDTVLTYEPDPYTFRVLADNVLRCKRANAYQGSVYSYCMALGAASGQGTLARRRRDGQPATHAGVHHVQVAGELTATPDPELVGISLQPLDALGLAALDLLYLDIEGFELFALQGAERAIKRFRPVIGVEINKSLDTLEIAPSDIVSFIVGDLGYRACGTVNSDRLFVPKEWNGSK